MMLYCRIQQEWTAAVSKRHTGEPHSHHIIIRLPQESVNISILKNANLVKGFIDVSSHSNWPAAEAHKNLCQVWEKTGPYLHAVIQRHLIVALGRGVEDRLNLCRKLVLGNHRPVRHVELRAGTLYLLQWNFLYHTRVKHLLKDTIIPCLQIWITNEFMIQITQTLPSQLLIV